jgi:hypothetical protein
LQGPAEPVEGGHDQGVASGDERQARGELRPVGVPAGFLLGEDPPQKDHDGFLAMRDQAAEDQERTAEQMRLSWEEGDQDPLIGALVAARRAKEEAEQQIRELLA